MTNEELRIQSLQFALGLNTNPDQKYDSESLVKAADKIYKYITSESSDAGQSSNLKEEGKGVAVNRALLSSLKQMVKNWDEDCFTDREIDDARKLIEAAEEADVRHKEWVRKNIEDYESGRNPIVKEEQ